MRLGLAKCWGLLIFDLIGLAISGYAFLLATQILDMIPTGNMIIVIMGVFIGIKILVMALYDLNRNLLFKNIPFIAALISILGNAIVFGISTVILPDLSLVFFVGLTIFDFLMVLICHLLWWVLIGKEDKSKATEIPKKRSREKKVKEVTQVTKENKVKKTKKIDEKKSWLDTDNDESEYDSIFTTLLENEKKRDRGIPVTPVPEMFEEEKRYQTGEFLKSIQKTLVEEVSATNKVTPGNLASGKSEKISGLSKGILEHQQTKGIPVTEIKKQESNVRKPELKISEPSKPQEKKDEAKRDVGSFDISSLGGTAPIIIPEEIAVSKMKSSAQELERKKGANNKGSESLFKTVPPLMEKPERKTEKKSEKTRKSTGITLENDEDFIAIEQRLGYLLSEIEKSMDETQRLQGSVSKFHEEVGSYTPIIGDEQIVATGNLIREKLKGIIDKQFIVDEVLDDLIRLSKLINNRIDDLDVIEAGLNRRKKSLDKRDFFYPTKGILKDKNTKCNEENVKIKSEEVIIENLDSEFIVAEEDYDIIRQYLIEHPEK